MESSAARQTSYAKDSSTVLAKVLCEDLRDTIDLWVNCTPLLSDAITIEHQVHTLYPASIILIQAYWRYLCSAKHEFNPGSEGANGSLVMQSMQAYIDCISS